MLRERRLRRPADFAAVYRRGRSTPGGSLAIRSLKTDLPESRVGFAVGKRIGNAVVRNRVKRRLRAAITSLELEPGWDIVINARPTSAAKQYAELHAELSGLLKRSRLTRRAEPGKSDPDQTAQKPQ